MRKYLLLTLFLGGCQTPEIIARDKNVVVMPDSALFDQCQAVPVLPDAEKLTDLDIAKLVVDLYRSATSCHDTLQSIKDFLNKAKTDTETSQ